MRHARLKTVRCRVHVCVSRRSQLVKWQPDVPLKEDVDRSGATHLEPGGQLSLKPVPLPIRVVVIQVRVAQTQAGTDVRTPIRGGSEVTENLELQPRPGHPGAALR